MKETIWTKQYIYLCITHFLIGLTFYMLATILPLYIKEVLNGNTRQMGLVITIYVLGNILMRLFSGYIVDKYGEHRIKKFGFWLFMFTTAAYFGVIQSLLVLFIVRFIHGAAYAITSTTINSIVIKTVPFSKKGEAISYFSISFNLAMLLGPSLGLYLWEMKNIYFILLVIFLSGLFSLILTSSVKTESRPIYDTSFAFKNVFEGKAIPIALVSFCLFFAYSSLSSFLPAFTIELNLSTISGLFFIIYALAMLIFRPFVAKFFDLYSPNIFFYPFIIMYAIGMILLSQAETGWNILLSAIILGVSYGILNPFLQSLTIKQSVIERSGVATATFFFFSEVGFGIGSFVLGWIANLTNYREMYMFTCVLLFISILIYFFFFHRKQNFISAK